MTTNWKHLALAKRWLASGQGMNAAATALRVRHTVVGRSPTRPAGPGMQATIGLFDTRGEQKHGLRRLRKSMAAKQAATVAAAGQQRDDDRTRRLEVLIGSFGMWKGRQDLPQDGLQYQRAMRAEWD